MEEEVIVLATTDVFDDILEQGAILVPALLERGLLGILLQCPYSPEQHVGVLHLIYLALAGALIDEVVDSLGSGLHGRLELVHLIYSKGQARKRDEHVASAALEPRIAS